LVNEYIVLTEKGGKEIKVRKGYRKDEEVNLSIVLTENGGKEIKVRKLYRKDEELNYPLF
jgi:hypothetical protein